MAPYSPACLSKCIYLYKYIVSVRAVSWRSLAAHERYMQCAGMLVNVVMVYGYGYRYNAVVQYSRNDTVGRRYCRLHRRSIYIDIVMLFAVFRRSERARRCSTMTVCNGAVLGWSKALAVGCGLVKGCG